MKQFSVTRNEVTLKFHASIQKRGGHAVCYRLLKPVDLNQVINFIGKEQAAKWLLGIFHSKLDAKWNQLGTTEGLIDWLQLMSSHGIEPTSKKLKLQLEEAIRNNDQQLAFTLQAKIDSKKRKRK